MPDVLRAGYDERLDFGRWVAERGRMFEEIVFTHLATQVALTRIAGDRTDFCAIASRGARDLACDGARRPGDRARRPA